MPHPREVLQRFRFVGAPGAAAGVPAQPSVQLAAELEPVLRALDGVQEQAARIRAAARQQADDIRAHAEQAAELRLATARASAEAWHREAASEVIRTSVAEQRSAESGAASDAQAVRDGAARRMPDYVARVVALILAAAGDESR